MEKRAYNSPLLDVYQYNQYFKGHELRDSNPLALIATRQATN